MSLLTLKLIRDIWAARWQFLAVTLVVLIGISFYQASWMSYKNIGASYELYYDQTRFGDFWITLSEAPDTIRERVLQVPGVIAVQPRIVSDIELETPVKDSRQVVGRVISMPDTGRTAVNDVMVVEGRYLGPPHKREVLLEKSFAEFHGLKIGDYVHPVVDGEVSDFEIVGIAMSPEYMYAIQSKQYMMPTPSTFGVLWMRLNQAERLLGYSGLVNDVSVITREGKAASAMRHTHAMLKRYGAEKPIPRAEQPSNYMLQLDLEGWQFMAVVFPFLFLFSAALTIYTLLVRLVNSQRGQIGFLRASGMSVQALIWHYLQFSLVPGLLGGVLGVFVGAVESRWIVALYLSMLNIPVIANPVDPGTVAFGIFVALGSCGVSGYFSTRRVALLAPAVALREEAVEPGHRPLVERLFPFLARRSFYWRVPMRNIFRNTRRTLYTAAGVAISISLILMSLGATDSWTDSVDVYINQIQRYDLMAGFYPPQVKSIGYHVGQWPGVESAEAAFEIPVELHRGGSSVNTVLIGLEPGSKLESLVAPDGTPVTVHGSVLLMSRKNRDKLGVETGDMIRLAFAHNDEDFSIEAPVRVGEVIRQPVGTSVYMTAAAARRLFQDELELPTGSITGLMVRGRDDHLDAIKQKLFKLPNVVSVEDARETRAQLMEMMDMSAAFTGMMVLLGAGLALAIIYNTVSINIVERTRELASIRAMGMGKWSVGALITIENLMLGGLGIVIGIPLGLWMFKVIVQLQQNDIIAMEPVIYPKSYLVTVIGIVVAILLSQVPGIIHLNRMNLAQATKTTGG